MDRRPSKKKLSRHLLDMKFMKRTKEKTQIEDEEEIRAHMFESEVTAAMRGGDRFVSEPSFVPVEHLIFGRLAFKGMNAEIESMMAERDQSLADIESRKREKDVTDVEMANSYSGLVATIGNKFATKRNSAGQPSGDRRKALLDMAGQSTNAHTSALLARTDEFLAETRRDGEEMDPERVMMGETEEEQEERETKEFLAQLRESQQCQEEQQIHPEMALMAKKKKDKEEWIAYVKEASEQQDEHPEMALMKKKKGKKEKGIEKKTSDFLSQMRGESEQPSAAKKPKFSKELEEVIQLNSGGGPGGGGRQFCRNNAEDQGLKLFVGGVGEETSSSTLEATFGKHGTVTDAYNSGRGFAFITYSTKQEANAAIAAMKGAEIDGKTVRCNLAKPKGAPGEGGGGGRPQAAEGCKLFVHGVSEETKNEDLQAVFAKHGTVTDTFNPGRGFAFVTFASPAEATKAIEALNQSEVLGRKVSIKVAKPKEAGGCGTPKGGGKGGIKIFDGEAGANKPKFQKPEDD